MNPIDTLGGALAWLGVLKSSTDVNHKIVMTLTNGVYELEERTILIP